MASQTGNTNSHNNMTSQGFYSFKPEEVSPEKKRLTLRTALCTQIFGVFLFTVGLVAGLLIGVYAFHGGPDKAKCVPPDNAPSPQAVRAQNEAVVENKMTTTREPVTTTRAPVTTRRMPKPPQTSHSHSHGHDHDDHGHDSRGRFLRPNDDSHPFTIGTGEKTTERHSPFGNTEDPTTTTTRTTTDDATTVDTPPSTQATCSVCSWRNPLVQSDKPEIFAPITPDEMKQVQDAMYQAKITTVKEGDDLAFNKSYIQSMALYPPIKADALEYLDRGGPVPERHAWVSVQEGAADPPRYMHYKVGPLGRGSVNVKIVKLTTDNECPFEKRPYDTIEIRQVILFVMDELYKVNDILSESFDSRTPYQDLSVMPTGPMIDDEGRRTSRFTLSLRGLGDRDFDFLNILPLHGKVYHGGMNTSNWSLFDLFYINQGPFANVEDMYTAYSTDQVSKIRYPEGTRKATEELTFPKRNFYQTLRENSDFPGISSFEPTGPRYDISGNTVEYLGWSFTVATNQHKGPGVYNVKFKNERIVYENSLSDIGLVYSADGSGQDNIVFSDATFGLGESRKAMPGVDCPEYASYLRTTHWNSASVYPITKLTICVFEKDAQEPLWRHMGKAMEAGMNNRYLVVRYPTQIGNYDYIIDFEFHLDGKMVTTATATGFIQGSFWNPFSEYFQEDKERTPFGYKVSGTLVGPIHDHTFAFKVDMDVVNEKNDFELINWKYGSVKEALESKAPGGKIKKYPNYYFYNKTRYITWESVENETYFDIDNINQKFWTVINKEHKNMWNVSRGYRIVPMASGTQNILDDYPRNKDISFTKHHLHVTKYHDDEHFIKPIYNPDYESDPDITTKSIDDMVNGESIQNSDIVTWLSLGFLHIPTSEDVPMTTRVTTGFTLKPFNFFDSTATFDIPAHAVGPNDTVMDNAPRAGPCLFMPMTVQG
ncbi:hypothetical protein FSP39_021836 [Pinctada imbricata]|uniref:Amine oxidase n=1 Tax=Pinctada imbricata TaxID=66713 RepID=A0AA88YKJ8_PINIB|nr:hypothetical protein FSP39_021836 [Pinctada imbricata]